MNNLRNKKHQKLKSNQNQNLKTKKTSRFLAQKSPRQQIDEENIWIYGKNPVYLSLTSNKRTIHEILTSSNNLNELNIFLQKKSLQKLQSKIKIVDNNYFSNLFGNNSVHQSIAIKVSPTKIFNQFDLLSSLHQIVDKKNLPNILILDQITDPQNVGAIIRSAVAFNFKKIIVTEFNSAKESSSMIKASAGCVDFADIYSATNINNLLIELKKIGYWCIGLAGEANISCKKINDYENIALVVGSEGQGIRQLVKKNCDLLVKIPTNNEVESLNVSVATAIVLNQIYAKNYV